MTRVLLTGGSVLDVSTGEVSRADVLLDGDRIVGVGTSLDGDRSVNCSGGLLVPGFIDCHTHVCLSPLLTATDRHALPRSAHPLSAVPVLRTLLAHGVTTVRDAWGADAGLRMALEQGWIEGPQIFISLRQVGTTGSISDYWTWSPAHGTRDPFEDPSLPDPVFNGPDQARAVVRRMIRAGADWIKVTATGSIFTADARDLQVTAAEMSGLVDEASRRGQRRVMVHAHDARAVEMAARAGAASIEHGIWLDEDAVAAMAEAGAWYVPTLSCTQADATLAADGTAEAHRRSVLLAIEAGLPIAMGSDNPVRPHAEVLREIGYLSQAGLGPARAIRASTLDAARLLGVADDRGEIAVDKRADLVLLSGVELDPTDLERRVLAVWHNGRQLAGVSAAPSFDQAQ